jgi:hypothetical protein
MWIVTLAMVVTDVSGLFSRLQYLENDSCLKYSKIVATGVSAFQNLRYHAALGPSISVYLKQPRNFATPNPRLVNCTDFHKMSSDNVSLSMVELQP